MRRTALLLQLTAARDGDEVWEGNNPFYFELLTCNKVSGDGTGS